MDQEETEIEAVPGVSIQRLILSMRLDCVADEILNWIVGQILN